MIRVVMDTNQIISAILSTEDIADNILKGESKGNRNVLSNLHVWITIKAVCRRIENPILIQVYEILQMRICNRLTYIYNENVTYGNSL